MVFLRLLDQIKWPDLSEVCISPINVYYREDWTRLLFAAFFHVDEWHLYYNMVSFLWKGLTLERRLGSFYFAYLIAVFSLLTNAATVALSMAAEKVMHDHSYLSQCAVGFSGSCIWINIVLILSSTYSSSGCVVAVFIPTTRRVQGDIEMLIEMLSIHVCVLLYGSVIFGQ